MSKADKSVPERPEQELIEAAKIGDRAAFEQLLDRHVRTVWRIAWRVLRHPQDAAEVTRDTFLAAHRTLPAFAGELRFSSWLERIAVGRAVKLLERQGERRHVTSAPLPEGQPVAALDAAEIARRVAAARMRLAGPQRAVLTLRDTDGRNWDEVEKILAAPHDAALQRLAHARLALRRAVTGRGETERGDQLALDLVSRYIDGDLDALDRAA
ncbi:RNA polymerase sigma factor, partial [bacterium]|nr:RNA polymerase sigma factor [bacterium]